ncbi:hypothetical protein J7L70_08250 [Candidatus Bathyarchaeota archaeon]|nr:hypothetical protein [Candidatus Bathyarchaeota archaeon]
MRVSAPSGFSEIYADIGNAGIGRVVNIDHETEVSRLFVSDGGILPVSPGMPPVLTIIALSKRFSKKLASEYLRR